MIDVTVKCFGPLRDTVLPDEVVVRVPSASTGETVFNALAEQYPGLHRWKSSLRLAVNLEYVPFTRTIGPDDEVCLIPPVSGG